MKNYLWNMFANIKNGQLAKRKIIFQTKKNFVNRFYKFFGMKDLF
jgi:hypothetical protein